MNPLHAAFAVLLLVTAAAAQLSCFDPQCDTCVVNPECAWCVVYESTNLLGQRCVARDVAGAPILDVPAACQALAPPDAGASISLDCAVAFPVNNPEIYVLALANQPPILDSSLLRVEIVSAINSLAALDGKSARLADSAVFIESYQPSLSSNNASSQFLSFVTFELLDQKAAGNFSSFSWKLAERYMTEVCESQSFGVFATMEVNDCSHNPRKVGARRDPNTSDLHPAAAVIIAFISCFVGIGCAVVFGFLIYSVAYYAKANGPMPVPGASSFVA